MVSVFIVLSLICCIIFLYRKEITLKEFIFLISICAAINLILMCVSLIKLPNDFYFTSGKLDKIEFHPYFVEEYQQAHTETYSCGTDSQGNTKFCTRTYYTTEHAIHDEYWQAYDTLEQSNKISKNFYDIIAKDFGDKLQIYYKGKTTRCTHGGHAIKGDNRLYYYVNETNTYNYPTTKIKNYYNPIKKSNSIFNTKSDFTIDYPERINWFFNSRNKAISDITDKDLDILNTKLYEVLDVNVNLIKLNDITEMNKLEDSWQQGKKNDINICYTGDFRTPDKVKVFGWYKESILKYDLERILLEKGIQKTSLNDVYRIIINEYKKFDQNDLKYLGKNGILYRMLAWIISSIIIIVLLFYFFNNNEDKDEEK